MFTHQISRRDTKKCSFIHSCGTCFCQICFSCSRRLHYFQITPYKRIPFHGILWPTKISGNLIGSMIASFKVFLACSNPATSSHWTLGFYLTITLSILFWAFFSSWLNCFCSGLGSPLIFDFWVWIFLLEWTFYLLILDWYLRWAIISPTSFSRPGILEWS